MGHSSEKYAHPFAQYWEDGWLIDPDVEWRMVYIGSADDKSFDQELESVMVGPVTTGKYKFVFQVHSPSRC